MSTTSNIKRFLYRRLSLEGYLWVVSAGFFAGFGLGKALGLGRRSAVYEYPRFLKSLVRPGDVVLDIGANLGYYSRILARLVGGGGKVYAVEPVKPILGVLARNLRGRGNVEIVPYALGREDRSIVMRNDTARLAGYMGTGRNRVSEADDGLSADNNADVHSAAPASSATPATPATPASSNLEFEAEMRRGSELFGRLERLDFVKCDVEGYETVVIPEMKPVIERHLPVVLLETGGPNRRAMLDFFRELGYAGYVVHEGRLVSVMRPPKTAQNSEEKDIVFIPGHRHAEFAKLIAVE